MRAQREYATYLGRYHVEVMERDKNDIQVIVRNLEWVGIYPPGTQSIVHENTLEAV